MSANLTAFNSPRPKALSVTLNWCGFLLIGLILVVLPRTAPVLISILGLGSLINNLMDRVPLKQWINKSALNLALLAIYAYLIVNASWSLNLGAAYNRVAFFGLFVVAGLIASNRLNFDDNNLLRLRTHGFIIGIVIALIYLALEILSNGALRTTLFNMFPEIRPGPKHISIRDGLVYWVRLSDLNRNLAAVLFVFWPLILIIQYWLSVKSRFIASIALTLLTALAIYTSEHASSMVAFPVGLLIFFWAKFSPRTVYWLHITAWTMGIFLAIPLALAAYQYGLHQKSWIPASSGQARIIIWATTAKAVQKKPVTGIGIRSTRHVSKKMMESEIKPEGFAFPRVTGQHSHNIFLQTWLELGGIGAALLLTLGLVLINRITRLSTTHQPYAFASFATIATIAQFSWGIWQVWYMALFVVAAFSLALAMRYANATTDGLAEGGDTTPPV